VNGATIRAARRGGLYFGSLALCLRRPVGLAEARAVLRRRLSNRSADFLLTVRRAVYEQPESPYLALLRQAGCELGDLAALVGHEGVEGALRALYRQGVYLTSAELKGRQPVMRGSVRLEASPARLRNPCLGGPTPLAFGRAGHAGAGGPTYLGMFQDLAVNARLYLNALGAERWTHAIWGSLGDTSLFNLLRYAGAGQPVARWLSMVDSSAPQLTPHDFWSPRLARWVSLAVGRPLPAPEYVPFGAAAELARWLAELVQRGETPHLHTLTSLAVELCQRASAAGLSLAGARLTVSGEPLTVARQAAIERSGAWAVGSYASGEAGRISDGCLAPDSPDDSHLYQDHHALVQLGPDEAGPELPSRALLLSSIRPTAPLILLNVSTGDQAEVGQRRCGCPLEALGWTTHLGTIRSFEKLTVVGTNFLDLDAIRLLEEELPSRFGGGPTDYQLVEQETDDTAQVRLRLLVHPRVGPLDQQAVSTTFLDGLARLNARAIEKWRQTEVIQVERRAPLATARGKVQHLYRAP
jgi:hypothetical protein